MREEFEKWLKIKGYKTCGVYEQCFNAGYTSRDAYIEQFEVDYNELAIELAECKAREAAVRSECDRILTEFEHDCQVEVEHLNAQVAMLRGALLNWGCIIDHQYSGNKAAMDFLQNADNLGLEVLSATEMKGVSN